MPTTKSAAKRMRSSAKCHANNKASKSAARTAEKKFVAQTTEAGGDAAAALRKAFSALDKAAKTGAIHKNKANRKKARLTAKLKTVKA